MWYHPLNCSSISLMVYRVKEFVSTSDKVHSTFIQRKKHLQTTEWCQEETKTGPNWGHQEPDQDSGCEQNQ